MELRPYQQKAKDAILNEWDKGVDKTLLVLPTGTGKTIVFAKVIEERVKQGDRCLVLAHRGELLDQAADKLLQSTGLKTAVEKAEDTAFDSWYRVTVGSVQTLTREKRLMQFDKDYYNTIIVDEAHHVISNSYQNVLNYFDQAKVLGVTATPDRGDMKNLGSYFESLAYEYSLPQAIKDGYLCKIKALTIPLTLDISAVCQQAGDFKAAEIGTALDPYLDSIADELVKNASDRKTVVFLPLIATSQKFTRLLQARGIKAAEINGDSPNREQILKEFDKGKYQVLCNSILLTEGWDCPSVDCIVVLRPTKIRSLYAQMVGRGTRLHEGKDNLLLLDFLWHTEKHELCRPASLISTNQAVASKMTEIAEQSNAEMDLEELEVQASESVVEERENALAEQLAEQRRKKKKLVDPLQFEMSIRSEDLMDYVPTFSWEMAPVSAKQKQALENFGVFSEDIGNQGKAAKLLDRLILRATQGLSTPKQIRLLEQRGFQNVGLWNKEEASNMISRIANNHWRIPYNVNPNEYKPGEMQ